MIIKKPYAFIIKHFRIIHLLLILPIIFLILKTRSIYIFLNDYINNNYTFVGNDVLSNLASNYVNLWMYLVVIVILVAFIFLAIVLQKKEKPTKFYKLSIIYYIALLVLITFYFFVFTMVEEDSLNDLLARFARDIGLIIYLSEFLMAILMAVRGSGFNIKKFNFENDLADLQISSEDSEEFEFLVGKDAYKTKRTIRRYIRELGYYYQENKFIFSVIFVIILVIFASLLYRKKETFDKVYSEGVNLAFGYINFAVNSSHVSPISMNGKVIKEDKAYVILEITLSNRYREDKSFNYVNLLLSTKDNFYSPNLSLGNYFTDYGVPFTGNTVKGDSENIYILVYEIDKSEMDDKMTIQSYSDYGNKRVNIKPNVISDTLIKNNVNKGTKIKLDKTPLKNTLVSITDYTLQNRFSYTYNYCYSVDNCRDLSDAVSIDYAKDNNQTLMVLDYTLEIDSSSLYMINSRSYKTFFTDFLEIEYSYNNKLYTTKGTVLNPLNYSDKLILKVPRNIKDAESVSALITIDNYSYSILLK